MAKLIRNALVCPDHVIIGTNPQKELEENSLLEANHLKLNDLQLEELKAKAYQQGYLSGKEEGEKRIIQDMELLKQQVETVLFSISQAICQNRLDLASEIANIILLIVQQYFIEKQSNPEALELQINTILCQLNNKQNIELCLHPHDINNLQKGAIKLESANLNGLKIKADERLPLGGCIIKTDHGIFDASIEKQIDRLKEFLLKMRQGSQHATMD